MVMFRSGVFQALLGVLLLLPPGCGTTIGNPPKDEDSGSFGLAGFKVANNDGTDFYSTGGQGRITLEVIQLVIKDVTFHEGIKPQTPTFAGTYFVDLVSGTIEPPVDLAQLGASNYSNVSFSLVTAAQGQFSSIPAGDSLIGNSLHIKGSLDYQGLKRNFDYTAPFNKDLNIRGLLPTGATNAIIAGKTQTLIVGLNIAKWFDELSADDLNDSTIVVTQILKSLEETSSIEVEDQD